MVSFYSTLAIIGKKCFGLNLFFIFDILVKNLYVITNTQKYVCVFYYLHNAAWSWGARDFLSNMDPFGVILPYFNLNKIIAG